MVAREVRGTDLVQLLYRKGRERGGDGKCGSKQLQEQQDL